MGRPRHGVAGEVGEAEVGVYHVILRHQAASSLDHARPGLGLAPCEHVLIVLGALQAEGRGRNLLTLPEIWLVLSLAKLLCRYLPFNHFVEPPDGSNAPMIRLMKRSLRKLFNR